MSTAGLICTPETYRIISEGPVFPVSRSCGRGRKNNHFEARISCSCGPMLIIDNMSLIPMVKPFLIISLVHSGDVCEWIRLLIMITEAF